MILDWIYFNTEQDWSNQNSNIEKSYNESAGIVVQSYFNLKLVYANILALTNHNFEIEENNKQEDSAGLWQGNKAR